MGAVSGKEMLEMQWEGCRSVHRIEDCPPTGVRWKSILQRISPSVCLDERGMLRTQIKPTCADALSKMLPRSLRPSNRNP